MPMPKAFKSAVASFVCALGLIGMTAPAEAGPAVGTVAQWNRDETVMGKQMRFMKYRGLTRLRFDAYLTADQDASRVNTVKMMQKHAQLNNIKLRPILAFPFAFGDRTDFGQYPKGDADALYRQGYNRTYAFVNQFKNDIDTYELGNELNLLVRDKSGQPLWGKGFTPAEFNTPLMNDWATVLKGASDAIDKINKDNGLNIRRVLNTTSTHFGFVEFMEQKGVKFEVISYHYYERLGTDPNKYWGSFNLFQKLASYKRPIFFNEVNCGEIYDPNFENKWYGNLVENCNKSLNNTLNYMFNQKYANIEEIDIYELVDHPERGGAEGRFGLNYGLSEWKITQLIAAFYAGGTITEGERAYITRRGYPAIQK